MVEAVESPKDELTIEVHGVTKRFGPTVAVNDVSFDVRRGEVVGFLGPNGSGKTTTMRLLTSYYTPDSGSILIEGMDNQQQDLETRRKIGYLPENNPLYSDMLVHEYLGFVADLRGLSQEQARRNIDQAVEETGIGEVYYRPVGQCSKGYRQRVGFAQAILHQPDILIMDEPTEGLDPNQRVPIRDLIRALGSQRTVLLSTHVLSEVEETCDRLLIISRGRIAAAGTVAELQGEAHTERQIDVEIAGDGVESGLRGMAGVDTVDTLGPVDGRERFTVSFAGDGDLRPEIFKLAKQRDWVVWELHQKVTSLQDLFHSLTADQVVDETVMEDGLDADEQDPVAQTTEEELA